MSINIYLIDVTTAANDYEAKKRRNMSSSVNDMFRAVQVTILDCPCSLNQKIFEDKVVLKISLNINVTFDDNSNIDLLGCLERHFQTWTANVRCKSCSQTTIPAKIYFWRLPPILIIHLGRWKDGTKNERFVDFPLENLDISVFLHPGSMNNGKENGSVLYSLYAVLQHHIVDPSNGHFTAKIKNIETDAWMCCNDTIVSEINVADVKAADAFMLYYKRMDGQAFLIIFSKN
uniref:ubiquitinyl hydrolase 1 n=1 Tax=Meloidogyne incognita TaxID=6306 RepID=A0A914LVJ8_MELIC